MVIVYEIKDNYNYIFFPTHPIYTLLKKNILEYETIENIQYDIIEIIDIINKILYLIENKIKNSIESNTDITDIMDIKIICNVKYVNEIFSYGEITINLKQTLSIQFIINKNEFNSNIKFNIINYDNISKIFEILIKNNKSTIYSLKPKEIFNIICYEFPKETIIYNGEITYDSIFNKYEYNGMGKLYYQGNIIYDGIFYDGFIINNEKYTYGIHYNFLSNHFTWIGQIYINPYPHPIYYPRKIIKHGKGRYFINKQLIYKGDYHNDKFNGFGKLYHDDILIYEGTFMNGEYFGKGKLYKNNSLIYKGDFINGKFHGKGKYYKNNSLIYEGDFLNDKYFGKGKHYKDGLLIYEGDYINNLQNGWGKFYTECYNDTNIPKLFYEGNCTNGKFNGYGKYYYEHEIIYEGEFINNKFNGNGKFYINDKIMYDGKFTNGIPSINNTNNNPT